MMVLWGILIPLSPILHLDAFFSIPLVGILSWYQFSFQIYNIPVEVEARRKYKSKHLQENCSRHRCFTAEFVLNAFLIRTILAFFTLITEDLTENHAM